MEVILYSTGCPKCHVLEKKLQEKNIEYDVFEPHVVELLSMGITEVPVLKVDDEMMLFKDAVNWIKEH